MTDLSPCSLFQSADVEAVVGVHSIADVGGEDTKSPDELDAGWSLGASTGITTRFNVSSVAGQLDQANLCGQFPKRCLIRPANQAPKSWG